jgi:cyclophilin family peptidyl-prolyl cis-trans isomerase
MGQLLGNTKEEEEVFGTVIFRLYDEVTPLTASNFRQLSIGVNGCGYQGSKFHRVVPSFIIQGGFYEDIKGVLGKSADGSVLQGE